MKSVLIASTCVSLLVNFPIPAWYAVSSFVQPPVKAAGKNARITFFLPRKSESLMSLPLVLDLPATVKSGATSPTFNVVFCGVTFCAMAGTASSASNGNADLFIWLPFGKRTGLGYHREFIRRCRCRRFSNSGALFDCTALIPGWRWRHVPRQRSHLSDATFRRCSAMSRQSARPRPAPRRR
jgi:hypothetical protein